MAAQCSTCFFGQTSQTLQGQTFRVCRQRAPFAIDSPSLSTLAVTRFSVALTALWQPVLDTDWCGDGADNISGISYSSSVQLLPGTGPSGGWVTGNAKLTLGGVESGWLLADDGTFGPPFSGASNRANNDTQSLFNLSYAKFSDADAPLLTSVGGATTRAAQGLAADAWATNCRMTLPRQLGRSIAIAGAGAGLTARALGHYDGNETHTQQTGEVGIHDHAPTSGGNLATTNAGGPLGFVGPPGAAALYEDTLAATPAPSPMDIMNPRTYWNILIKL